VAWRSAEVARALVVLEGLLVRRRVRAAMSYGQRTCRTLPLGKDAAGRLLYSFLGDEFEGFCVVWCVAKALAAHPRAAVGRAVEPGSDRWSVYRGPEAIAGLARSLQASDAATSENLADVLQSASRRARPATVLEARLARNEGWRFSGDEWLGRAGRCYDEKRRVCSRRGARADAA
jgi:hypothetical protein